MLLKPGCSQEAIRPAFRSCILATVCFLDAKARESQDLNTAQNCLLPLHHKPLYPADLHNSQPVPGAHFMLHSVEVIFHRLLRETKAICDFLVSQTFRDERD